jgi:alkanesulfonate monooxygenase SsuD/methylene tetrahydromethanopterin reductase-like flavin-dependent oxidoreductase (luciferase family)
MTREIRFNAFDMNCVGHQSPGLWAHPRDPSWQYKDLEYWVELAEILERGKFDGLFIADVLGVYVYRGNLDAALRNSTQIPVNDPLQLVPAMALVTKHLGFGLTASLSFEHPYTFARRLSTLDHLTKGRAGWNIVTSYLDSGAEYRSWRPGRARRSLRRRRRIYRGLLQALGRKLGGRCGAPRSRPAHLHRSDEGPSDQA